MVDLKGPLIRTMSFKDGYSTKVKYGQKIRISSNTTLQGDEGMIVIDYPNFHEKVLQGDKILIDYGGVILTVLGVEPEEKYLKKRRERERQNSPFKDVLSPESHL